LTLIKSISGIRGTIGGAPQYNLTPVDIVSFASAYGTWLKKKYPRPLVVIGRDGRLSGPMVSQLVSGTLCALGIDLLELGLSTTPTVEMAVILQKAQGGIILTASHNPKEWNALKLLNDSGEFLAADAVQQILDIVEKGHYDYVSVDKLGFSRHYKKATEDHIKAILQLPLINKKAISRKKWRIVVDGINSSGATIVPLLLYALGIDDIKVINKRPLGEFSHNPEPLTENLKALSASVIKEKAHLGIAVDPDVDRLVFINEDGTPFGEEYTLVAISDYILQNHPGNCVSNLSSSRALADIAKKHKCRYYAAAVGEVNVVKKMKAVKAIIGGEGNGGIILPQLHYGRDAMVGIALFLTYLATLKIKPSQLRHSYPQYEMIKDKIALPDHTDIEPLLNQLRAAYTGAKINIEDGVKIDMKEGWMHLRRSNTEPIIRIYAEARDLSLAKKLADDVKEKIFALWT